MNRLVTLAIAASLIATLALTQNAMADVRFGDNVRIGGHDASNQTFTRDKRGEYILYDTKPKKAGCVIRQNRDGSKTKVCRLQRKPVPQRAPADKRH
ncbi:hypothetical protein [Fulvimarina sp. MAC3]|uniref:hypothetical protein n=1 Tax=Fulvimarina sp. MAC3 TaxID=3148887 RepID=UPI0031FD7BE2